jgi:hypothetical protein
MDPMADRTGLWSAALAVSVLASGCAESLSVNGQNASQREYDRALSSDPPTTKRRLPTCIVAEVNTSFVTVVCSFGGDPPPTDVEAGLLAEMKLAAQTAIVAGKTSVALVNRALDPQVAHYRTPRVCSTEVNVLRAFGVALAGAGGAYQDRAHCTSSRGSGGDVETSCTVTPAQRIPDVRDTTCVGGVTKAYVASIKTSAIWRMLTDEESATPAMSLLPKQKQPISCEAILTLDSPHRPQRITFPSADASPDAPPANPPPTPTKWDDPFVEQPQ